MTLLSTAIDTLGWTGRQPADQDVHDRVDLRVLVISADGTETDLASITHALARIGIPHDTFIATRTAFSPDLLFDGAGHGRYEAVFLATGSLAYLDGVTGQWQSAFGDDDWSLLAGYEARFGIRRVLLYTFPSPIWIEHGLIPAGVHNTLDQPLQAHLTPEGTEVFHYLNPTAPITFSGAQLFLSTLDRDSTTIPLVVTDDGSAIVSVHTYQDGRQHMAVTVANAPELMHSLLLSYGIINWATRGLFLGARHASIDAQVDDIFIPNSVWDPEAASDGTGRTYRITGHDFTMLTAWQARRQATGADIAGSIRLDLGFVGMGAAEPPVDDPLTDTVRAHQSSYTWFSHTWDHLALDEMSYEAADREILLNDTFARRFGFSEYEPDSIVQGNVSGLHNPEFLRAAAERGIRYVIADTSQPGWSETSPNQGFSSQLEPDILIVPRRPTNLFCNVTTPEEWVSEYNHYYGVAGIWRQHQQNLNYQEILDRESDVLLRYLLGWELSPLMFHQANLRAYDGSRSLLGDLIDATVAKYEMLVTLPIRSWCMREIGARMAQRMAFDASDVTATVDPGRSITLCSSVAVTVPVTGVAVGPDSETYGGQPISYVRVQPDIPTVIMLNVD